MEKFFWDKYELGMWELKNDLLFRRIPPELHRELIEFAWDTGHRTACEYRKRYQTGKPSRMAELLGLEVLELGDGDVLPEYRMFSEYLSNLKRVVLYRITITAEIERLFAGKVISCRDYSEVRELFIAHELYHHIECHHQGLTSQARKISTFKFGPINITSGVRALCEIGAHSFTKTLLNVDGEGENA